MRILRSQRPTVFEMQALHGAGTSHFGARAATDLLIAHLDVTPKCVVLDVGCGSGHTTRALRERFDCPVIGVDKSDLLAAAARDYSADAANAPTAFVVAAAERLPFASGVVDRVIVQSVFAFVADADVVASECTRVMRPGGRFALNEATSEPGPAPLPPTKRMRAADYSYRQRRPCEWRSMLGRAGLRVIYERAFAGGRWYPVRSIAKWLKYTGVRLLKVTRHSLNSPNRWIDGLVFVDLFLRFSLRESPYVLIVAERGAMESEVNDYRHLTASLQSNPGLTSSPDARLQRDW